MVDLVRIARRASRALESQYGLPWGELLGVAWEGAVRAAPSVDRCRNPAAFVFTAAKNAGLDELRKRRHTEAPAYVQEGTGLLEVEGPPAQTSEDAAGSVFERLVSGAGLSAREREVLYLRGVWGMGTDEIVREAGGTPAGVRKMLQRAREKVTG